MHKPTIARRVSRFVSNFLPVVLVAVTLGSAAPLAADAVASLAAQATPPATAPSKPTTPPASTPNQTPSKATDQKPKDAPKPAAKDTSTGGATGDATDGAKADLEYVIMTTSMGDVVIELDRKSAPLSVENFLKYVDKGFYDGTIFHRVMPGFVVQGGGFDTSKKQKATDAPIKNEWENGLKNKRGTIAMARTNKANTATSQFYFNLKDNAALDMPTARGDNAAYAVFGTVIKGMDVVDKIAATPTSRQMLSPTGGSAGPADDVPVTDVTITNVKRVSAADAKK